MGHVVIKAVRDAAKTHDRSLLANFALQQVLYFIFFITYIHTFSDSIFFKMLIERLNENSLFAFSGPKKKLQVSANCSVQLGTTPPASE